MHQRKNWVPYAVLAFGLVAVSVAVVGLSRKPDSTEPERPEEVWGEAEEAFPERIVRATDDEVAAFRPVLDEIGRALKAGDAERVMANWSVGRAVHEGDRGGADGFRYGFRELVARGEDRSGWDSTDIRGLRWLTPEREVLVVCRHATGDPTVMRKLRWWLTNETGRWQIYDAEDLDVSLRVSDFIAATAGAPSAPTPPAWLKHVAILRQVGAALEERKFDEAERLVARLNLLASTPPFRAVRFAQRGMIRIAQDRCEEALADFDRAAALNPDMPALFGPRAGAHYRLGRPEEALKCSLRSVNLLGPDADVLEVMGHALVELGRARPAADSYRQSLAERPDNPAVMGELRRSLPPPDKGELADHLARMSDPAHHAKELLDEALFDEDVEGLEALLAGAEKAAPAAVEPAYYRARVALHQGRHAEALTLFREALTRIKDDAARHRDLFQFLIAARTAGQGPEAYAVVPDGDATAALRALAGDVHLPQGEGALEKLLAAHRKRRPDDPWLDFFQGKIHVGRKEYDEADAAFAAGMAKPLDEADRQQFRHHRVAARYQAGRGLAAYEEVGPANDTFSQLAWSYYADRDRRGLQALVDHRRKKDGDGPDVDFWQARAHWLARDYAKVAELLTRHADEWERRPEYAGLALDHRVRALVRLKLPDEARRAFEASPVAARQQPVLGALIAAASGDVAETGRALAVCTRLTPRNTGWVYNDEDLGPLLQSERFRPLHATYPPPPPVFAAPTLRPDR